MCTGRYEYPYRSLRWRLWPNARSCCNGHQRETQQRPWVRKPHSLTSIFYTCTFIQYTRIARTARYLLWYGHERLHSGYFCSLSTFSEIFTFCEQYEGCCGRCNSCPACVLPPLSPPPPPLPVFIETVFLLFASCFDVYSHYYFSIIVRLEVL